MNDAAEVEAACAPIVADFTATVGADVEATIGADLAPTLEAAADQAPTLEAVEAETDQVTQTLDQEMSQTETRTAARAAPDGNAGLGDLVDVNVDDPAADALARRIGGRPSVRFSNDPAAREFDAISDEYVAQSKPANFQLGSSFRNQAKATFEVAKRLGRTPYFHFEGPPNPSVIAKLEEYAVRYGIKPVIDTTPLGG